MILFAQATKASCCRRSEFGVFSGRFKLAFCLQRRTSFHIIQRARDGARGTVVAPLSMFARPAEFPLEAATSRMKCARLSFQYVINFPPIRTRTVRCFAPL